MDKAIASADEAVADLEDGARLLIGGFGDLGVPFELLDALVRRGLRDLTITNNNCGTGERGVAALFKHHMVRRVYSSFPAQKGNHHFRAAYDAGEVEVHVIPQGTLAERIRAAGAGLGGFLTPTGVGTAVAEGKQLHEVEGRQYLLEYPLRADVALLKAHQADPYGNLRYRLASRNFNPLMAMAAKLTIAQVSLILPVGGIDPDDVHTPGIFVDRVVQVSA